MKRNLFAIAFVAFISSACSIYHVNSVETTEEYYPSKQTANEVVHLETVTQPHEIIATVTVNTERRKTVSEVIGKMKREAAILGGDAITDIRTDSSGTWKKLPAQAIVGNAYVRANYTASVVVFKSSPAL